MKGFIFWWICTIQIISGKEENFEGAIKSAVKQIKQTPVLWKSTEQVLKNILTLIEESNAEYSKDIERISKEVTDQTEAKALAEYQAAYEKLIAHAKEIAYKFTRIKPKLISKIYDPVKIAKEGFKKITKKIKMIKKNCKKSDLEDIYSLAFEAVNGIADCILDGAEDIPTIPEGVRYIKDLITIHTQENINNLKHCPHDVGLNCVEPLKKSLLESINNDIISDESVAASSWLRFNKKVSKSCVTRNLQQFTNKIFGKLEQCILHEK